jgi:DtxR family Mn-dependent transcriptional regulator
MESPSPGSGLSRSSEDYLKVIYGLEHAAGTAQTGAIAELLGVAAPSVSGMLKRLADVGMVNYQPYRGVTLTRAGRRVALKIVRRHRVLESYLAAKLGYGWDSVHEEAERLEHAVSDEMIERMAMALGNPLYDPHGAPIPSKDGAVIEPGHVPLSEVPVGETAELKMVSDRDSDRLRYLGSLGLRLGAAFEVIARQPFRGPVTIRLSGTPRREEVVGHELAESLGCVIRGHEVG